jgi:hypothetical protein|tara:strand:+ start:616 stop:750 length:135 start_codon:yes stop_codon:yes gene_type:complete
MIKELIQAFKEDPTKATVDFISIVAIFGFGYILLLLAAILEGNV